MSVLVYLFWPNPGGASYAMPKVIAILTICAFLVVGSFAIRWWRHGEQYARRRMLSRSWSGACLWFGIAGIVLVIARVEQIQFVAMRFWWIVWGFSGALYIWLQIRNWQLRYYEVLPQNRTEDPREKYLPRKKHRR